MTPRILIVEDEPIVAINYAAILRQAGIEVVGPVGTLEQALHVIERESLTGALLDLTLFGQSAEPIAVALIERKVPFVIVSGLPADENRQRFGGAAQLLSKPCRAVDLIHAVQSLGAPSQL